jgi:nicotinate phosphoribosyltransferase
MWNPRGFEAPTGGGTIVTGALATDLYELNMAASYLRRGMTDTATFSLFVRRLPPGRGFLVAAGLESCLRFLEDVRFAEQDLDYLRDELAFRPEDIDAFASLRFTGDVWAVPEGRVVYASEPLLEVTAPLPEGQLVETFLLNQITFHTMLASKAARCRLAAGDREVVDFAFRRTQGADAADAVARDSAIVGFAATSNVAAARRYGLRAAGTMAHSYIEAFPTEAEAFRAFASDFPARTTFLVDTYDALAGVRTAIDVIRELGLRDSLGIRLDSGDLEFLSAQARTLLDDAGLGHVRIFASGGLDDIDIDRLVRAGAPIDAFGVGTRMGVSADAPFLDTAYKLAEYAGRPVLKLSPGKISVPSAKQVYRLPDGDLVSLRDEPAPAGGEALLQPVMRAGARTEPAPAPPAAVAAARVWFERDAKELSADSARVVDPLAPEPTTSERLQAVAREAAARALAGDTS